MESLELDPDQRVELQQSLSRREEELVASIARLREALAAPAGGTSDVRDSVEDGDARMATSVDLVQLQRQEDELSEVRHAHDRVRSGDYGRCEACDEPIPFERLRVRPAARFCLKHEEAWEKAHPRATVAG